MIINSNFRDYYDCIAASGVDNTIVYNRYTKFISHNLEFKDFINDQNTTQYIFRNRLYYDKVLTPVIIGFCGKTYLIYRAFYDGHNTKWLHSFSDFDDFVKEHYTEQQLKKYNITIKKNNYWYFVLNKRKIRESFIEIPKLFEGLFVEHNTPIFAVGYENTLHDLKYTIDNRGRNYLGVSLNPTLSKFQFQKVIDPYTAFQEISMYISGVLGVGKPDLIEVSDKTKIEKAGFDNKISFRGRIK